MRPYNPLVTSACLLVLDAASTAHAQSTNATSTATDSTPVTIEDVVVTATRQSTAASKVPMSIAAVTQASLDQQGIKEASDLTSIVPSLTLVNQTGGVATFAIRGIVATTGAATTGVYLDDTAMTKRNNAGVSQNNGAPLPVLFDLERVEVLKGPQGTLYGGSSEGGTIRFITPTPSLTTYSGLGRVDVGYTEDGAQSHEFGAAFGGPIIQDTLGFRLSGVDRRTGGWIDVVNPYSNASIAGAPPSTAIPNTDNIVRKDANGTDESAARLSLLYKINDNFNATLAGYYSRVLNYGGPGSQTDIYAPNGQLAAPGQTYTTPTTCYNTTGRAPTGVTSAPAAVNCATAPVITYTRPSVTYGPWNLADNQSLAPYDGIIAPARTTNAVGSLTLDYNLDQVPVIGPIDIKSITSYIEDSTTGDGGEGNDPSRLQTTLENPGRTSFPLFALQPVYSGRFLSLNHRHGIQEELRFSSTNPDQFVTWVAGMFYSSQHTNIDYHIAGNYDAGMEAFYGIDATSRYGIPNTTGNVAFLHALMIDSDLSGFGEVNFNLTSKLKLTGGVRISSVELKFNQSNWGQLSSRADPSVPFATVGGDSTNSPVTPKAGISYQITPSDMVYFNAAQGYRAGGVNVALNPQVCNAGLALFGLTADDIPASYGPDTVWSYELGGKFRMLDNRLQVNAAAFMINWSQIQVTTSAQGCGQNWNQNGGSATSRGFDLQTEFRPTSNWSFNAQLGYTNAYYTQAVLGPQPTDPTVKQAVTFNNGDPLGVPKFNMALGVRYDHKVFELPMYARLDYTYQGAYQTGSSFGTGNYNPFTRDIPMNYLFNLRIGANWNAWDVSGYVENLLNSHQKVGNAGNGQTGCALPTNGGNASCSVYSLWSPFVNQVYQKPLTLGIQLNYHF